MLIRVRRTRTHPADDWTSANPWLGPLEMGIETEAPNKAKINFSDVRVRWNDLDYWNPSGAEASTAKVYRALLTQSGTDAPVATVLENTLGGTVVWTRNDVGEYVGTLATAFAGGATKVWCNTPSFNNNNDVNITVRFSVLDANELSVITQNGGDAAVDFNTASPNFMNLEILVYP